MGGFEEEGSYRRMYTVTITISLLCIADSLAYIHAENQGYHHSTLKEN